MVSRAKKVGKERIAVTPFPLNHDAITCLVWRRKDVILYVPSCNLRCSLHFRRLLHPILLARYNLCSRFLATLELAAHITCAIYVGTVFVSWWMFLLLFIAVVTSSFARIQLGVHYPSDCVFGVIQVFDWTLPI